MEKAFPQRSCIGCRSVKDKNQLLRIVRSTEGDFRVDLTGRAKGRGAYLCPQEACLNQAVKKGAFSKSFRQTMDPVIRDALIEEIRRIEKQDSKHAGPD